MWVTLRPLAAREGPLSSVVMVGPWPAGAVQAKPPGGGRGRGCVLLNVELVQCQLVHEGLHQVVGGEVEDQAEEDGDGQRRQGLLEDGQEEERQAQALCGGNRVKVKVKVWLQLG